MAMRATTYSARRCEPGATVDVFLAIDIVSGEVLFEQVAR
jgi:hypothetical protein